MARHGWGGVAGRKVEQRALWGRGDVAVAVADRLHENRLHACSRQRQLSVRLLLARNGVNVLLRQGGPSRAVARGCAATSWLRNAGR